MSGRFDENEADDVYGLLAMGRFMVNEKAVFKSKRGKVILQELKEALLALPEKRLASNAILDFDEEGKPLVCTLGAYAIYKGVPIQRLDFQDEAYAAGDEIINISQGLGMTFTMAWILGDYNDTYAFENLSPEELWEKVFAKVEKALETGTW